jgi:hypothetical protein
VLNVRVEHTDTFAGEANYGWVHRHEFEAVDNASRRALVRRAKAECGLTNEPCDVIEWGDEITIKPRGLHQIVFITCETKEDTNEQE